MLRHYNHLLRAVKVAPSVQVRYTQPLLFGGIAGKLSPWNSTCRGFSSTNSRSMIPVAPIPFDDPLGGDEEDPKKKKDSKKETGRGYDIFMKCLETAGIMVASLSMLGLAGLIYHRTYKERALTKMSNAFTEGNPAFELSMHQNGEDDRNDWLVPASTYSYNMIQLTAS
ncbi:hypothetical protein AWJ20_1987 [Sugiyamaella lignohabitans]|uniref:Uncharacterized protein n=1 Tax=Sugiyamaella lignohabitans TaxID=796027 RepID=A0A167ES02_9ASCO|nr:uncharacterized protein AWJ20_1987 [Sugiyamaella lignohabitans]ANB14399.1 hypothetical protein AWJ20_1987 [Sugiyamaella lignohabitans]